MHNLVPYFILEQFSAGNFNGEFSAVGLFADISGFSDLTEELMRHGQHGAEELALIMRKAFRPMIRSVYQQNGFIATLAGDSITALFPLSSTKDNEYLRPLAAAWEVLNSVSSSQATSTNFGDFNISVKVGVALGEVKWGIVSSKDQRRAIFYFYGSTIEGCVEAEKHSASGEIVVDSAMLECIHKYVRAKAIGNYHIIEAVNGKFPAQNSIPQPSPELSNMIRFFPQDLVSQSHDGEFRQVVNLFVNLPTIKTSIQLEIFVQTVFDLQESYGGLLNRLDFGDKGAHLLMFWGAPVTYENDIERSMDFILTLQEETSIPFHAGLTYQISHAGFIGSELREEYTCYGKGVNLASRYMVSAPRGMIWIDEQIAQRAESLHKIEFLGDISFKGFTDKQPTYALLERKDESIPFFRGELVGREAEIEQLVEFVRPLKEGGYAGVFVVWGEAGIGKSRLVHEFQNSDNFLSQNVLWALCQTDQILREAFNPFRYWLKRYFGISDTQSEARNKRSFNQRLDLLIAKTEDETLIEELDRTRSFLGALIGLHWPDSLYQQSKAQGRYENTLAGLATLLLTESTIQPVIIHLEDAHWLDADSRSFLSYLAGRSNPPDKKSYRIAIIASARPKEKDGILGDIKPIQELTLERLGGVEISSMANKILSAPPSPKLLDLLSNRADGNPFFTEQILYYLLEQELLYQTNDGYDVEDINHSLLPADVRSVLVARLDRLNKDVKEVVQVASILGREFEVALLAEMLPNETGLAKNLLAAEHGAIWSPLNENRYIFKHALMQDAAYQMQLLTRRQELHSLAVNALEKQYAKDLSSQYGALAYHSDQAGDYSRAYKYFSLAAERARQIYIVDEAINYYTRALELSIPVSADAISLANLHRGRGRSYEFKGDFNQARSDFEDSNQFAKNAGEFQVEWRALIDLGRLWASRDYQKTRDYFEESLKLARQKNDLIIIGGSLNWMGNWSANNEKPLEAFAYHQEALNIFEQLGNYRYIANTLDLLAIAHLLAGDYNASVRYYNQAIPMFREMDNRSRLLAGLIARGVIVSLVILLAMVPPDPAPNAPQDFREAIQIAREIGSSPDEAWASWASGLYYTLVGMFGEALKIVREGVRISTDIGHREWLVGNLFALGVLYCELLAPEKALIELQPALDLALELRSQYWINHVTGALTTAYLLVGDLNKAQSSIENVITNQTPMDTKGRRYCWARRAELTFAAGDPDNALLMTDRLIDSAAGMAPGRVITFLWLLKGKILTHMNQVEEAELLLNAALMNAKKTGERFLQWKIQASLGQLYQKTARLERAEEEISATQALIKEMASTIHDENLKHNFSRAALESL